MNEDHADAVQLYADKLLGLPGAGWTMTGIDARRSRPPAGRAGRAIAFETPLAAAAEARPALVSLVAKARAA